MKITQIDATTFEIEKTFLGITIKKYNVFVDYASEYVNFKGYNAIYYKASGRRVDIYKSMKLQDSIEACKRLKKWNS